MDGHTMTAGTALV